MNEAIQSSFDYIISDCEKSINSLEIQFYGDIFKLLKLSYTEIAYNEIFKKSFPKKDQISSRCLNPKKIEAIREKFSNILPNFTFKHP